ncbi:glycoside hydrolase family 13 protein [Baudoinia panamericana UAMH 10762]|uniref:alpha-amylase n=1 Tax=Baudoinia panamericana (strain UAMH 10762) TaxID=717646 RepID=M2N0L8_BAUPA|nr:glycoside hydrolase family 13 protein [Baudoinia panamericana UAMH 10762]EMC92464.1 glycoside hydrolase family 13 protein [Baudoinia panamericana UAMH 10762]
MYSKNILLIVATLGLGLCHTAAAASSSDWRTRSIYQVLTDRFARTDGSTSATCNTGDRLYCGGSYVGIQNHLDYIQDAGFDAIWISPVTAQLPNDTAYGYAYHGYWQQNLYELNSNFGTAEELQALSTALHDRGMYLMVDVVVNHNGWDGSPSSVNYADFYPFNKASQYHPYCGINYDNTVDSANIEDCWVGDTTVSLPDLRTEDSDVATGYQTWIKQLVANYSIDGLRLDTVMEVDTAFWADFETAAGVYMIGEVDEPNGTYVCSFQNYVPGVLNYGTYFPLFAAFSSTSGDMDALVDMINTVKYFCKDTSLIGSFSENHDQPRFASVTGDMAAATNIISYTMLADGIPIIYEGQEQHYNALGGSSDPYNREAIWFSDYSQSAPLYVLVKTLNTLRKHIFSDDSSYLNYQSWPIYSDTTTIAVRKGYQISVLSNKGSNGASYTQSINTKGITNTEFTEILSCATLSSDSNGNIVVPMGQGQARLYYPTSRLSGSGLCGASSKAKMARSPSARSVARPFYA